MTPERQVIFGRLLTVVIVASLVSIVVMVAKNTSHDPEPSAAHYYGTDDRGNPIPEGVHNVTYYVHGNPGERAHISYTNANGGMDNETVDLPFTKNVGMNSGDHAFLTAQSKASSRIGCGDTGGCYGYLVVEVAVKGAVRRSTCQGDYCVADVGGIVP